MNDVITSIQVLMDFMRSQTVVDRKEVVAHATLSAWVAHWPQEALALERDLLAKTQTIQTQEASRWLKQRRIALAKLSKKLC